MNLAALAKHKNTIIAVVALIIVCGGTFLGVRALNRGVDTPQVSSTTTTAPTLPTTQPTTIPTTVPTTAPTTAPSDVITTYPIDTSTSATAPTTQPTTAPTTQPTLPSLPSTQGNAGSQGGNGLGSVLDGLGNLGGNNADKNYAILMTVLQAISMRLTEIIITPTKTPGREPSVIMRFMTRVLSLLQFILTQCAVSLNIRAWTI